MSQRNARRPGAEAPPIECPPAPPAAHPSPDLQATDPPATGILPAATADAERCLARWLRAGAETGEPPDMRELNAAVTALRRLIDARKALRELNHDDTARPAGDHTPTTEDHLCQAIDATGSGSEEAGDPDSLPD